MEKEDIKQQILEAIQNLTNEDPDLTVGYSSIFKEVKNKIQNLKGLSMTKRAKESLIKKSIYSMKNNGEIGYRGRNQYCLPVDEEVIKNPEPYKPTPFPERPNSAYFQVPSKKKLPENTTDLDPNKGERNSSELSKCSLSGDEFERRAKEFHGTKRLIKFKHNPPLPGARQVETINESDLPGSSVDIRQNLSDTIIDQYAELLDAENQSNNSSSSEYAELLDDEQQSNNSSNTEYAELLNDGNVSNNSSSTEYVESENDTN